MSILTKKVTMTETAWAALDEILKDSYSECVRYYGERAALIDVSDAITALAEAEIIAVTDTYSEDRWRRDAEQQGCRCGVCDRA